MAQSKLSVSPGSSAPFYIVSYYIKWATNCWTYSMKSILLSFLTIQSHPKYWECPAMYGEAHRSKMEPENLLKDGKSCIGFSVDGVICYLYSQATFLQWSWSWPFIEFSRSTDSLGFLEPEPCSYLDLWSKSTSLIGTSVCQCLCPVRSLGPLEPNLPFIGTSGATLSVHWDLLSRTCAFIGISEPKRIF